MDANRSNGTNLNHELAGNSDVALSPDGQENVSDSLLDTSDLGDEADLDSMRKRINEMEEEAEKLKRMQDEVDKQMQLPSTPGTRTFVSLRVNHSMHRLAFQLRFPPAKRKWRPINGPSTSEM